MKKKTAAKRTVVAKAKPEGLAQLIAEVRNLIQSARRGVSSVIDTFQVLTNFEIGRRIVEHEQKGEKRAGYGQEMLKALSTRLTEEFGRGFSVTNLQLMRKFFIENQIRIQQQPIVKLVPIHLVQKPSAQSSRAFTLSWTHYVIIDLKLDKLTHQDLGQMQMYVNYFDRQVKLPDETPTVGLLLCKAKKDAIVELTLPKESNIQAREYKLYLPSKKLLKQKLLEWSQEAQRKP